MSPMVRCGYCRELTGQAENVSVNGIVILQYLAASGTNKYSVEIRKNPLSLFRRKSILPYVMPVLESTQDLPLSIAEDGAIRIANTRVSLESVVHHYEQGATAEEIVLRFPALRLADVHSCLAYYLNHPQQVHEYIARQQQRSDELRQCIAADPVQQSRLAELRERIHKRAATRTHGIS